MREDIIGRQATALKDLVSKFVAPGDPYSLVDFPDYANVGDSAIWLGALKLLRQITGRSPSYTCAIWNYDQSALARARGPIFMSGGGNFGDLYPRHQNFRMALIRDFPGRTIVQLPQSIHFSGQSDETARAIAAHGDCHLLVRDAPSESYAARSFECPVTLAPDCAFALGPLRRTRPSTWEHLCLFRSDDERARIDYSPLDVLGPPVRDWLKEPERPPVLKLRGRLQSRRVYTEALAAWRLKRGLDLLSSADFVFTDRLHGHILSVLLDIPHVAFDNSTGKLSAYHEQWLADHPTSRVVSDAHTALSASIALRKAILEAV